jgi:hypothetical protein
MFRRPTFARTIALPPQRELPWSLKPLDSAKTSVSFDKSGRLVLQIWHDVLKGLTPEMLAWWFGHIGGQTVINGILTITFIGAWPDPGVTAAPASAPNSGSSRPLTEIPTITLMSSTPLFGWARAGSRACRTVSECPFHISITNSRPSRVERNTCPASPSALRRQCWQSRSTILFARVYFPRSWALLGSSTT